ncbi:MAG: hypothetical protein Q9157_004665 [Trypethelium eluteriae]
MTSITYGLRNGISYQRFPGKTWRKVSVCSRRPAARYGRLLNSDRTNAFSTSGFRLKQQQPHRKESFSSRLGTAWKNTKIEWYPIPVAAGVGFLGFLQFYRIQERQRQQREQDEFDNEEHTEPGHRPKKRPRIRPEGPWSVQIMSTLPLKFLSRLWGKFNEIELPYYFRIPGFKLYSWIFGVNLDEVAEPDLHVYPNLAAFFYRQLKPGCRPLDPNPDAILSPADGKIIQFGMIEHGEVEQVKGVTYSLDALLGSQQPNESSTHSTRSNIAMSSESPMPSPFRTRNPSNDEEVIRSDEEFARVNGISYTLPHLLSGGTKYPDEPNQGLPTDQSTTSKPSSESEVRADLALANPSRPWWAPAPSPVPKALYYCVVYLAPGDYHRFHSPVSWVVESRRHFAGELYSVSPYLQRTLPGLFVLNERVVLLGRWRHGFFSYAPVGATNVGSIKINFDKELRTNSLTTDTEADRQAERAKQRGEPYSGFAEAYYDAASKVLGGHALKRGEEMGGFQLGSTIVLVFEAPKGRRRRSFDEGFSDDDEDKRVGGWKWNIDIGQKVKVGQALGSVDPEDEVRS